MPDSKVERDRLARKKGVEFCGKTEFLASNKEAQEAVNYRRHIDEGGERLDKQPASLAPFIPKPAWAKDLTG